MKPVFGNGIVGERRMLHAIAEDSSLTPLTPLQSVKWWVLDNLQRPLCLAVGCHFSAPAFRSNRLYFCTRCKREMFGRGFSDLVPEEASDSDWWDA